MIQHVWENACTASSLSEVWVATDDERIAATCTSFGASVALTSPQHPTGTDRLAEVARSLDAEIVVNIQGDEPLIEGRVIDIAVQALIDDPDVPVATVVHAAGPEAGANPDRVKVVLDRNLRALYFSRSEIPAQRGEAPSDVPEFARSTVKEHLVAGEADTYDLSRLLVAMDLASSRAEARRLLQQSAVEIDGQKPSSERMRVPAGTLIRAGRRRFARIVEG